MLIWKWFGAGEKIKKTGQDHLGNDPALSFRSIDYVDWLM